MDRSQPGRIRDAITDFLAGCDDAVPVGDIEAVVVRKLGAVSASSIRSYLGLNTPELFERTERGRYRLRQKPDGIQIQARKRLADFEVMRFAGNALYMGDCMEWLKACEPRSFHAVVTDPPYGLVEYSDHEQAKLRKGKGGVWRIPPSFDGVTRAPLPRFTTLSATDIANMTRFFEALGLLLFRATVPGANIVVASNPLLFHCVATALANSGLEPRGSIARLVMTMRGGDRPKNAHNEFRDVSVMPRSMWEPWLVFRRPLEGRAQDNLRKWRTGGFRRPSGDRPFGDVIKSHPTSKSERQIAPHPSLKPQSFLREIVQAVLPMGEGTILDPFAGSGSTVAAAMACGYRCIGIEKDQAYFDMAADAVPLLSKL
jgi:16S rRNA G966 N2-methylase RsmD